MKESEPRENIKKLIVLYKKRISDSPNSSTPNLIIEFGEKAMLELNKLKENLGFQNPIYNKEVERVVLISNKFMFRWKENNTIDYLIQLTSKSNKQDYLISMYNHCEPIKLSVDFNRLDIDLSEMKETKKPKLSNQKNLKEKVQELCDTLNQKGFKNEGFKWQAGNDPKSTFGGGICFDKKAFMFLKNNGHLDKTVCWKCGKEPISNKYYFTDGIDSSISYKICSDCFSKGKEVQNQREGKGSSNCYIATVCYGDVNAPEVESLRQFRDNKLSDNVLGNKFIGIYYKLSPAISEFLKNKKLLNNIIKILFLDPIVELINRK